MWTRLTTEFLPSFISTFLLIQLCSEAWAKTGNAPVPTKISYPLVTEALKGDFDWRKGFYDNHIKLYMDKYGDCFRGDAIEVDDEKYTIRAQGGEAYDTLVCEMTFESVRNDRLCVSFRLFSIRKCDVKLDVFSAESSYGSALGSYNCKTEDVPPEPVCSEGKYLTVRMRKDQLSHDGYDFNLELREYSQSDAFTQGIDAYILSIGVIVAIIVGVIVLVVLTSVVIVYCCCKRRPYGLVNRHSKKSTSGRTGVSEVPVEPSAPPLPVEDPPPYFEAPPPYTSTDMAPNTIETYTPETFTPETYNTETYNTETCQITDEEKAKFQC